MPTRIDVELTSARPDGTWTWRAAGARQPKGVLDGALLPEHAKVGDVLKVEAHVDIDGIVVLSVVPTRPDRKEVVRLEIILPPIGDLVTGASPRDDRPPRKPRRDGGHTRDGGGRRPPGGSDRRDRPPRPQAEGDAAGSPRPRREYRPRPSFTPPPELPQRPKPKRLRAGRAHQQALVAELPEEHRPIAEQLLRGGLPAVRHAVDEQNAALRAEGKDPVPSAGIESLAQDLLPRMRVAEWLDRAEGAKAILDEIDLRDLRSVVTASSDPMVQRDHATSELAQELRRGLERRQDEELALWLSDIDAALEVGRVVRALRLSSRPPKAGALFPPEVATRLTAAATEALTPDAAPERWAAVVEALAYSPIHSTVTPAAPPGKVSDDLRKLVESLAPAVPQIATLLGITPPPPGTPLRRPPRRPSAPPRRKPDKAEKRPSSPARPATREEGARATSGPEGATEVVAAPEPEPQPPAEATAEPEPQPPAEATAEPEPD